MHSATPIWIMLAPLALLTLVAVAASVGFAVSKWQRANPRGLDALAGAALGVVGVTGLVLLGGLFFYISRSEVSQSATIAPPMPPPVPTPVPIEHQRAIQRIEAEIASQRATSSSDASSYTMDYGHAPPYQPHHTDSISEVAPTVALRLGVFSLGILLLLGLAVGAILFVRFLVTRNDAAVAKSLAVSGGIALLLVLAGALFVGARIESTQKHQARQQSLVRMEAARAQVEREHAEHVQQQAAKSALTRLPSGDDAPVSATSVAQNDPVATDDRTTSTTKQPDWVRAGIQRRGDVTILVCSSKQYATEAEANQDARAAVRDYLLEERLRTVPAEPFRLRTEPAVDHLIDGVVKDRYVEALQRDFGTMFATMYRVWLRAEVTPDTYHALRSAQLAQVREGRMVVAGSTLAALLCVPLGIVSYGQLNRWTRRRIPRILQSSVAAGVVGAWIAGWIALQQFVTLF
jgi:hypothetical protein